MMIKRKMIILTLMMGAMLTSCDELFRHGEKVPEMTSEGICYSMTFSFKHQGEVKEDSCSAYNIISDAKYPEASKMSVKMDKTATEDWLLTISLLSGVEDAQSKTTFQMTCPYVFHDKEVHEIVAQWVVPDETVSVKNESLLHNLHFAKCVILSIDGKDIKSFEYVGYPNSKQGELTNLVTM